MAQNFLPIPVSTLTPDALDAQKIMRRQALAEALLQSSAQPINPQRMSGRFMSAVSPFEGLAKLAEAAIGTMEQKRAERQMGELARGRNERFANYLRGGLQPGAQGAETGAMLGDADASYDPNGAMTASDRYSSAFNTPGRSQVQQDPTQQMSLTAPSVIVSGAPESPAMSDPLADLRRQLADAVSSSAMDPQTAMQTLMGAQMELWKARNMPQKLGEGEVFGMPGQAPLMSGPQKYRAPQFLTSGAGMDEKGRPLETQMRFDPNTGAAVPVPGVKPVTKGPLATASATATNQATKGVLEGAGDAVKDRIKTVSGAASAAPKTIETIHSVRKALDTGKVSSGPGTTFGMALKQIGQSMGMGVDQEALNKTRTVITGLAEMTLQARGELKGQGQVTENEQKLLERARSGDIDRLSIGEIRTILDIIERTQRYWLQENRSIVEKLKSQGGATDAIPFLEVDEPPQYGAAKGDGGFKVKR